MGDYSWIGQLGATGAVILFCYLLINSSIKKSQRDSQALADMTATLKEIEASMAARDQIILNHLEHFGENQRTITEILRKLCHELDINGGI